MNCPVHEIGPDVLRSGRLMGYRKFRRLKPLEAQRLAIKIGRTIPERVDYSLAEIYNADVLLSGDEVVLRKADFAA